MPNIEFTRVPTLPFIVDAVERDVGGKAVRRCFDVMGLRRDEACGPGAVLPIRDLLGLFEWFARERGDGSFGLFAADALHPEAFGLFVVYAMQAPTLRDLIRRLNRSVRLHQTCSTLAIQEYNGIGRWSYRVDLPLTFGRHHHGVHVLLQFKQALAKYLGFPPQIIECGVEAASYGTPGLLEERLGAPIRWSCDTNYITFSAEYLDVGEQEWRLSDNPVTFADLLRYARTTPPQTTADKTRAAVRLCMARGDISADAVAGYLNTGVRTLQRQLSAEGTAYYDIVEQVRRERARELMSECDMPLWRVAGLLGYTDPAHFTRAYRRWYGYPPSLDRRPDGELHA